MAITDRVSAVARGLATAAFIVAVPVFLISTNLRYVVNAESRYRDGFETYQIPAVTGITLDQLMVGARGLIAYFNSDQEFVDVTVQRDGRPFALFNPREILHLKDVKALIQLMFRLNLATGVYGAFYVLWLGVWYRNRFGRPLAWALLGGGALTIALLLAVAVAATSDFDSLFLQFHFLSFRNDLWQLDPRTDFLIAMYPEGFFYDATVFLALASALEAGAIGALSAAYLVLGRRRRSVARPLVARR